MRTASKCALRHNCLKCALGPHNRLPQIATWKSVVLGSLSLGALGVAAAGVAAQGEQLSALWSGYTDPASWAALGWAGLGPGALASYLHVVVSPGPAGCLDSVVLLLLLCAHSFAALLWPPVALTPACARGSSPSLQGQRHVAPAQAQVIFSSKPLWAAGLAWVLLGGEELGPLTWAGGAALAGAGLVASTAPGEAASPADQKAKRE